MLVGLKFLGGSSLGYREGFRFQTKGSKFNMNLFDILNRFRRTAQTLDDINFLNKIYVKLPPKDNIYFTLMLELLHPIKMFLNIHLAIHLDFYHKTYILIHVLFHFNFF